MSFLPHVRYFLPTGVPEARLQEEVINLEEVEAIRLCDLEQLGQGSCAEKMGISQSTFNRLIESARSKLARCIVEGRAISIRGGNYELTSDRMRCMACGNEWLEPMEPEAGVDPPESCPRCRSGPIALVVQSRPKTIDGGVHRYGSRTQ